MVIQKPMHKQLQEALRTALGLRAHPAQQLNEAGQTALSDAHQTFAAASGREVAEAALALYERIGVAQGGGMAQDVLRGFLSRFDEPPQTASGGFSRSRRA